MPNCKVRHFTGRGISSGNLLRCVLLQRRTRLQKSFPELPDDVFPTFPIKSTLKLPGLKVSRNQIPLTPGFAVTDYKVQGATFKTAVLDLRRGQKIRKESHKRFWSTYVQLSRLQSLDGVQLLEGNRAERYQQQTSHKSSTGEKRT